MDFNFDNPSQAGAGRVVSLDELAPGATAVVEKIDLDGPVARRLADLGFLPGTPVTAVRRAPLGDPIEFELRGTRLCLRRSEAARVRIRSA